MKLGNCLFGIVLLCGVAACEDAVVGRFWPSEATASTGPSTGGASEATTGAFRTSTNANGGTVANATTGASLSTRGGTAAVMGTSNSGGMSSSTALSGGASSTSAGCPIGIEVRPSTGVCSAVPAMGDVDCNGTVDINDALKLAQLVEHVQAHVLYEPAGDLNCDGCLTNDDATLIAAVTAGSYIARPCDGSG